MLAIEADQSVLHHIAAAAAAEGGLDQLANDLAKYGMTSRREVHFARGVFYTLVNAS